MKNKQLYNLIISSFCLALCLVLPFLTAQLQQLGNTLCPMHLPVFICGFIAGPAYGAVVGFIAPLLRSMLFGMPVLFPMGAAMSLELAVYGFISGFVYRRLAPKMSTIYISLISAMITGRLVWGVARAIFSGVSEKTFTWTIFITDGFINAIPGIIIQLILIPLIINTLEKTGHISKKSTVD